MQYPEKIKNEMENTLVTLLQTLISKEKIYRIENEENP